MKFQYSTTSPEHDEFDSLPRLELHLRNGQRGVDAVGLVDSGATVNVLPHEIGLQLGGIWEEEKAVIRLGGNLGSHAAMPFFAEAFISDFDPVRLAFAWTNSPTAPLILGQTNFFMEFDVCFYRSKLEFEIKRTKQAE